MPLRGQGKALGRSLCCLLQLGGSLKFFRVQELFFVQRVASRGRHRSHRGSKCDGQQRNAWLRLGSGMQHFADNRLASHNLGQ